MSPRPPAELLDYLAGVGWTELRRPEGTGPEAGAAHPADSRREPASAPRTAPASDPDGVRPSLAVLQEAASACRACRLAETRKSVVFGDGSPTARLMFVGEGPGAEEDRRGLPFVGRAGELLDRMIGGIGLERKATYIANIVKCRPPGNRDPEADEVDACRHYLEGQIDAIRPTVLVALGRVAAQSLLGNDLPLGRQRGIWYEVRGVPTRVTYHPAALLRNESLKRPTWEDLKIVRDRLNAEPTP